MDTDSAVLLRQTEQTGDACQVMLGSAFDTRPNAFNAVRLALASTVIVWHSVLYTVNIDADRRVWQALEQFSVDGFFVISGFLIVRSWDRRPEAAAFIRARLSRLVPGLWVCLVVTAFLVAPMVAGDRFELADQLRYVLGNAGIITTHPELGTSMPTNHGWNPSLWSLWWELLCYAAVLGLGVAGALRARTVAGAAALFWVWMLIVTLSGAWLKVPGTMWLVAVPRLGFMFALGALAYFHRGQVPLRPSYAGVAVGLLALSVLTPNYHLLGAPALGYLVLWAGIELGRFERLQLKTDLSYGVYIYGTPTLIALVLGGVTDTWWLLAPATLAAVVPLAAASWFLVERPALRWARGRRPVKPLPSPIPLQEMA